MSVCLCLCLCLSLSVCLSVSLSASHLCLSVSVCIFTTPFYIYIYIYIYIYLFLPSHLFYLKISFCNENALFFGVFAQCKCGSGFGVVDDVVRSRYSSERAVLSCVKVNSAHSAMVIASKSLLPVYLTVILWQTACGDDSCLATTSRIRSSVKCFFHEDISKAQYPFHVQFYYPSTTSAAGLCISAFSVQQ